MSLPLRVPSSLRVGQLKRLIATRDPRVDAAHISLHLCEIGEMEDDAMMSEYQLPTDRATKVLLYFHTGLGSGRTDSTPVDISDSTEEQVDLRVVFSNTPATATDPTPSRRAREPASSDSVAEEHLKLSRPLSGSGVSSVRIRSRPTSGANMHPSGSSSPSPPLHFSSPSSSDAARRSSSRSSHSHSASRPNTSSTTGDTSRRFLEDDGDIASQSSEGGNSNKEEEGETDRQMEQIQQAHEERMRKQQEQQQQQQQQPQSSTPSSSDLLASAAGYLKGDLLDGYRLLHAAAVDLPEEASRIILSGCNPPLVDAVPEHLAEFVHLNYLDVSGNNLPFDRLRLLPLLDDLNMSCNHIRDFDFSPIPGIHYNPLEESPQQIAQREFMIEDVIGFAQLTKLDCSYNYLSQAAIHILSVLPRLTVLSLAANDLLHLPPDLSNFWKLQKLSLKNNRLGSGRLFRKLELMEEFHLGNSIAKGTWKKKVKTEKQRREITRPLSAISMQSEGEEEEEQSVHTDDGDDQDERERRRGGESKEWKLFQALSTMPNLIELDLSENLLTSIPAGCIPSHSSSFPKLQFLNLSLNQFESDSSLLPLGDLVHLSWLDLRGNPFIMRARPSHSFSSAAASSSSSSSSTAPVNYALLFPDLYHVLVSNCRINVVMCKPRLAAQNMQPDVSHIMKFPQEGSKNKRGGGTEGEWDKGVSNMAILESEAKQQRERIAQSKQQRLWKEEKQRQLSSSSSLSIADNSTTSLGFSTAHEFSAASAPTPQDSLQHFLGEQQRKMFSLQRSQHQSQHQSRTEQSASKKDSYAEQYEAYSHTFLTGMNLDELQNTRAFEGDKIATKNDANSSSSAAPAASTTLARSYYPPARVLSKKLSTHATVALRSLLNHSSLPVLSQLHATHRYESTRAPAAARHGGRGVDSSSGAASNNSSTHLHRDRSTNQRVVSLFGIRQPKVAKVYARMEEVLDRLEKKQQTQQQQEGADKEKTTDRNKQHSARTAEKSSVVDAAHYQTHSRLVAARQMEKEEKDVQSLLRTVAEVSKVALL